MKKELLIKRAKRLRADGHSFCEIGEKLSISKSTAYLWVSNEKISVVGIKRLEGIRADAIKKSQKISSLKKEKYLDIISKNCLVLKERYSVDDMKIWLALLFWGEGSKTGRRLVFVNSDPELIKLYLYLLRNSFPIIETKFATVLHLHKYHDEKKSVLFWAKICGINKDRIVVYKKENSGKQKKENYPGCISIRYGDVRILDELFEIIKRLTKKFAGVG